MLARRLNDSEDAEVAALELASCWGVARLLLDLSSIRRALIINNSPLIATGSAIVRLWWRLWPRYTGGRQMSNREIRGADLLLVG